MFEEEIDSGSKCPSMHPIMLVAEGYALCHDIASVVWWYVWRMTPPRTGRWELGSIGGRDGKPIDAWIHWGHFNYKEDALACIQADIDAHRALPFDEEAERARLMPV